MLRPALGVREGIVGRGRAGAAKQAAEELVLRDRVQFLAGFDLSPHAMAVGELAKEAKVPVLIMNAATASITRGSPYYVRLSMTIPQFVVPTANWAYKNGNKDAQELHYVPLPATTTKTIETTWAKEFKGVDIKSL